MKEATYERRKSRMEKDTLPSQGSIKPEGIREITNRLGNKFILSLKIHTAVWNILFEDIYGRKVCFL